MGGSSLAPDILADTFGPIGGYPRLFVLDSTCPAQIKELEAQIDIPSTLFIISSKSGTTTEPNAFYCYFHEKVSKERGAAMAGRNFVAITDPGTTLDKRGAGRIVPRVLSKTTRTSADATRRCRIVGIAPSAIAGYDIELAAGSRRSARCTPTTAPSTRAARRASVSARRSAASPSTDATSSRSSRIPRSRRSARGPSSSSPNPPANTAKASCRSRASRSALPASTPTTASFVYVGANLPDPEPGVEEKLRALEAAGHPVIRLDMNDDTISANSSTSGRSPSPPPASS